MNDLLVTSITPTLGSGTGLRTYGVTAALARHHAVEVAYVIWGGGRPAAEYARLGDVTLRALHASRGPRRGVECLRARARGAPPHLARGVSPELAAAGRAAPPDVRVIADGPVVAAALLPVARTREVVYLAHNLESSGFRGKANVSGLVQFERRVLQTFSEAWMATRADEQGARALAGEQIATRYVPNVLDTAAIEPVAPAGARRLLFIGDFTYAPNREALEFLAGSVLPEVWQRMPDVRLRAVGRGLPAVARDSRIETPGFVEELGDAYRAADIVVVPLLRGGGSPLKFVEGLAYGLPVVATAHAAALIEDGVADRDFLAVDGAADFAGAIEALLADPGRAAAIGAAGRQLAVRGHSVDALATLIDG
ncbi:MAG: glycosyltransferase [Solirubrobacteraceae bacterium]